MNKIINENVSSKAAAMTQLTSKNQTVGGEKKLAIEITADLPCIKTTPELTTCVHVFPSAIQTKNRSKQTRDKKKCSKLNATVK